MRLSTSNSYLLVDVLGSSGVDQISVLKFKSHTCRCLLIAYPLTIYLSVKVGPSLHMRGLPDQLMEYFCHFSLCLDHALLIYLIKVCLSSLYLIHLILQVVKLYERCLIACANYPELWIRYVLCMEASGSMELAYNALARATQVFVKVFILFVTHSF